MNQVVFLPIVHERQSLQFCALHSLNNLLQLSSSLSSPERKKSKDVVDSDYVFRFGKNMKPFTKSQLDSVANQFILAESDLFIKNDLSDDKNMDDGSSSSKQRHVSFLKALRSNHRTPFSGNYSYEVIDSVLQSKGICLEWYNVQKQKNSSNQIVLGETIDKEMTIIGFLVNEQNKKSSWYSSILGSSNRHWFAITRLRSVTHSNENNDENTTLVSLGDTWCVLDSQEKEPLFLHSNDSLVEFLLSIEKAGGSIFRASTKLMKV